MFDQPAAAAAEAGAGAGEAGHPIAVLIGVVVADGGGSDCLAQTEPLISRLYVVGPRK